MASKDLLNLLDNAVAALSSEKHTLARNQYAIAGRRPVSAADASTNTYRWSDADTGGVALLTHSLAKLSADHEQTLSELLRVSASESSAKKELQAMRARLASAEVTASMRSNLLNHVVNSPPVRPRTVWTKLRTSNNRMMHCMRMPSYLPPRKCWHCRKSRFVQ